MASDLSSLIKRIYLNVENGNYRDALYFTDLAMFELQQKDGSEGEQDLKNVLLLKSRALKGLNKLEEAQQCMERAMDIRDL